MAESIQNEVETSSDRPRVLGGGRETITDEDLGGRWRGYSVDITGFLTPDPVPLPFPSVRYADHNLWGLARWVFTPRSKVFLIERWEGTPGGDLHPTYSIGGLEHDHEWDDIRRAREAMGLLDEHRQIDKRSGKEFWPSGTAFLGAVRTALTAIEASQRAPRRMSRSSLAREMGIHRTTIDAYERRYGVSVDDELNTANGRLLRRTPRA